MNDKLDNNLAWLHFNYETKTDTSIGLDTKTNKEEEVRDDEMFIFDKITVKLIQKYAFSIESDQLCLDFRSPDFLRGNTFKFPF